MIFLDLLNHYVFQSYSKFECFLTHDNNDQKPRYHNLEADFLQYLLDLFFDDIFLGGDYMFSLNTRNTS